MTGVPNRIPPMTQVLPGSVIHVPHQISLRDHFAAAALQGLLANGNVVGASQEQGWYFINTDESGLAKQSYMFADSMLAERAKAGAG